MSLPSEIREIIFKQVLRHARPIRPRCPYGRLCDGFYPRHRGKTHCSSLPRCGRFKNSWADNDNPAPARLPHFWSILLANRKIHAEAAWMLTALNTFQFGKPGELECFHRDHPVPIPASYTDGESIRYPPQPKRDMRGVQHISLTLAAWRGYYPRWPLGKWYERASEQLARHIRPFKDLRTLELLIWDDCGHTMKQVSCMAKTLPRSIKCRFEPTIGGKTAHANAASHNSTTFDGTLLVRVIGVTDDGHIPDWLVGFPLSDLGPYDETRWYPYPPPGDYGDSSSGED